MAGNNVQFRRVIQKIDESTRIVRSAACCAPSILKKFALNFFKKLERRNFKLIRHIYHLMKVNDEG